MLGDVGMMAVMIMFEVYYLWLMCVYPYCCIMYVLVIMDVMSHTVHDGASDGKCEYFIIGGLCVFTLLFSHVYIDHRANVTSYHYLYLLYIIAKIMTYLLLVPDMFCFLDGSILLVINDL